MKEVTAFSNAGGYSTKMGKELNQYTKGRGRKSKGYSSGKSMRFESSGQTFASAVGGIKSRF